VRLAPFNDDARGRAHRQGRPMASSNVEAAVLDRLRAMRRPGESFDYEFAAEPSLLHRERTRWWPTTRPFADHAKSDQSATLACLWVA
jgi:hypothetical protein